ncbi:MFS general substrate transporter [Hortaea werneckii]|nr:MFS general substrate transporter [Hortaea werneckii]KAI7068910.1 MFS general substrate transporter [Hortaea werneckii]KAI7215299.1 MFS general substrate transporter [Hortaea werneckii]KAI7296469.1 MFS general substrate transporter [Hortaea werneckii]
MVPSAYKPVVDQEEDRPESSGSSSAHVGSDRYTPEEGSDDDELEDLEESEGYELKRLNKSGPKRRSTVEDAIGDDDHDDVEDEVPATRRRTASVASFELYTPDEEHRVRRKLDTHLVLFVAMLYMMSFLDRSNIGNAKIAGLVEDLKLDDDQYEWLLTAFYIAYILFEWMTLCYKIFPPHIYISCCVMAWGVLASLQSITSSFGGLLVLRTLLGIGEAAFVGIPFYLSFFFRKDELAFRIGLFISAAPLATSFASSLAWGIVSLGGKTGIASWRLLFLLEGFPACLVAVWAWWWLPDNPASARWLRDRDRKVAILRMRKEDDGLEPSEKASAAQANLPRHKQKFNWRLVLSTLKDPKAYLTAGMFFCCNVAFSSMPVFLPTIVSSMGFSQKASQGLSAPPFLFAFFVVLVTAFLSDRIKSRSIPMIFHATLAMLGYIVLAVAGAAHFGHTLRYLAVFPICAGFFSAVTIVITWTVNNQPSDEGKGTGMAMLNVIGQMGPLVGTRLYPDAEAPYYVKGMAVCAVSMAMVAGLALALRLVLKAQNARSRREWHIHESDAEGEALVGDNSRSASGPFIYLT